MLIFAHGGHFSWQVQGKPCVVVVQSRLFVTGARDRSGFIFEVQISWQVQHFGHGADRRGALISRQVPRSLTPTLTLTQTHSHPPSLSLTLTPALTLTHTHTHTYTHTHSHTHTHHPATDTHTHHPATVTMIPTFMRLDPWTFCFKTSHTLLGLTHHRTRLALPHSSFA